MTVQDGLRRAAEKLASTSDAPAIDAQRLMLHVLQQSETSWLFTHGEHQLSSTEAAAFQQLIGRRHTGYPLAYLLGQWDFYGRPFAVTPDVLIPRPATEALIDQAVVAIQKLSKEKKRPLVIADIGTGSGCIAVTLALEAGQSIEHIYATDISEAALAIAKQNISHHGVEKKITLLHGDLLAPIANKNVDLIVSNPPYLLTEELHNLSAPEKAGLRFEPHLALDGGRDGQDYVAQITLAGIPTILEGTNGVIKSFNIYKK